MRLAALRRFVEPFKLDGSRINWPLLHRALVHPSCTTQEPAALDNDRLEFLGDEVVRLIAAEYLYREYPDLGVGEMTAVRSVLVSDETLAALAGHYQIGEYLIIGRSAEGDSKGELTRLADGFEAVLGALYLSSGNLELIRPWLLPHLEEYARTVLADPTRGNYKTALQEWTQKHFGVLPDYQLDAEGPPFQCRVLVCGQVWGHGLGDSKKIARQAAARAAYEALRKANPKDVG